MLTDLFWNKVKLEMRLLHIINHRPSTKIKLDPLSEEDFTVSLQSVKEWSQQNLELYEMILENGMAEFICNKPFLYEFYTSLAFIGKGIKVIDHDSAKFSQLKTLNLSENKISTIEYIPSTLKELYLDFNIINDIQLLSEHSLQLLSVSHNCLADKAVAQIAQVLPQLRCLNISYNKISNLKDFVMNLASLHLLKILVGFNNPISMLKIYYKYVTDHLPLLYIDGNKYVKEEPKPPPKPVQQKKEVVEEKKDPKKDAKKGGKVQQKPPQPPKVEQPVEVQPKELTSQDFQKVKMEISITNLQQHSGTVYDAGLFPPNTDSKKIQTNYWLSYTFMGETVDLKDKSASFDSSTTENGQIRLNLQVSINKEFSINNFQNHALFNKGLKVLVHQVEPKMVKDPDTLELKPELQGQQVIQSQSILGGIHIDLRPFHLSKDKTNKYKYRLFTQQAVNSPLFLNPFQDETQLIQSKKSKFEEELKRFEEEALRKAQEEQQLMLQKKGKDNKKGADKKAAKKDGKDAPAQDKVKSEPCSFPIDQRLYCVIDGERMFKGKELLCVDVKVQ